MTYYSDNVIIKGKPLIFNGDAYFNLDKIQELENKIVSYKEEVRFLRSLCSIGEAKEGAD